MFTTKIFVLFNSIQLMAARLDTRGCVAVIFYKAGNIDFIYTFLHTKAFLKKGATQQEKNVVSKRALVSFPQ